MRSKIRLSGMVDIYLEELLSSPYLVVVVVVVDVAVDPEASMILKREPRDMCVECVAVKSIRLVQIGVVNVNVDVISLVDTNPTQ